MHPAIDTYLRQAAEAETAVLAHQEQIAALIADLSLVDGYREAYIQTHALVLAVVIDARDYTIAQRAADHVGRIAPRHGLTASHASADDRGVHCHHRATPHCQSDKLELYACIRITAAAAA